VAAPCACGLPKRKGSTRYCEECWLRRRPMPEQVEAARARLALMPAELRVARVPAGEWPAGRRWCSGCQSFVRLVDCTGSRCRACASAAAHAGSVARTYGISAAQYQALLEAQGGRCYLCRRRSSQRLAVDHDHACCPGKVSCGKCVRGLLCAPERGCNLGLVGYVESVTKTRDDAVAMAERLVSYLTDPPASRVLADP
jgi:hypothetical protein